MRTLQHIALADDWDAAQRDGVYALSTIGMTIDQVGYMHASFPEQVRATLERFYAHVRVPLVLLTLDEETLTEAGLDVRVEAADPQDPLSEKFPHVYGGDLPVRAVARIEPLDTPDAPSE